MGDDEIKAVLEKVLASIENLNRKMESMENALRISGHMAGPDIAPPRLGSPPDFALEPPPAPPFPEKDIQGPLPDSSLLPPSPSDLEEEIEPPVPAPPPFTPYKVIHAPRPPKPPVALEKVVGIWLSRVGVVLVFFAAAFFLKLVMDQIGPLGKVMLGIMVGVAFLGGGEYAERKKYTPLARALTGGGLMILYLSIFASFGFFKVLDQVPAFILLVLITAVSVTLSVRYNSQVILILALVGGFITPVLVSTGQDNQIGLMSYMVVLDSALLVVAYWRKWRGITLLCFSATLILFMGWAARFYSVDKFTPTLIFASIFFVIFAFTDLIHIIVQREVSQQEDLILISCNAVLYFACMYYLIKEADMEGIFGVFALALALVYFGQVRLAMKRIPQDVNFQRFITGFAVAFLTLAIPLQLDYESVTVIWAAEAAALSFYGLYGKNDLIRYAGLIVFAIAIVHLCGVDPQIYEDHARLHEPFQLIFAVIVTYLSALLAGGAIIYSYRRFRERVTVPDQIYIAAYLFEIVLVMVFMLVLNHYFFESRISLTKIYSSAHRGEDLNVSLILGVYSSILITAGILYRLKWMRYYGLAILAVCLFKVVLIDMAGLPLAYRMLSFLCLGILLIGLSILYTKYRDRWEGVLSGPEPDKGEKIDE